jgi:hypothetical protein
MLRPAEKIIFESFVNFSPEFAGRPVKCEEGPDPPDYICVDDAGNRIGVELGEWLNEQQTRESKERERLENSYCSVIKSEEQEPPHHVGSVYLSTKLGLRLDADDRVGFKGELLQCIQHIDDGWSENRDRDDPQGYNLDDFDGYPSLAKYLTGLQFRSRRRIDTIKGISWIGFRPRGGAYSPKSAVEALLDLLRKKGNKYAGIHTEQNLAELFLIVYYDQALIHNTPYFGIDFGMAEVVAIASVEVARNPGPFQKIFLFNSIIQDIAVYRLWP